MTGKILIVDDERTIRRAMRDALAREGHFAVSASGAEEAIRRCKSEAFDLLITDLKMPGMSGLELIREVKAILPCIRAIVITAYASAESAVEALRLGVSDYMVKPFRLSELRFTVGRLIGELKAHADRETDDPDEQQDFEYQFGSGAGELTVRGRLIGCGRKESVAAREAVRIAARAVALYVKKNGGAIDPVAAAETISDVLYFEHKASVGLACGNDSRGRGVLAGIGPAPGREISHPVASPGAGSFPGLRAVVRSTPAATTEVETPTATLGAGKAEFVGYDRSSQTLSLDSNKADLKRLVAEVGCAARAAGLDAVQINDIVAAVNEAVLNSIEHGYGRDGSGKVDIGCRVFAGEIVATVQDYGSGFDPVAVDAGAGFAAFKRLADRVAVESAPGAGTKVYLAKAAQSTLSQQGNTLS